MSHLKCYTLSNGYCSNKSNVSKKKKKFSRTLLIWVLICHLNIQTWFLCYLLYCDIPVPYFFYFTFDMSCIYTSTKEYVVQSCFFHQAAFQRSELSSSFKSPCFWLFYHGNVCACLQKTQSLKAVYPQGKHVMAFKWLADV